MLAILAAALATLAPLATAAEGQGDNDGNKQPTMAELGNKVDSIVRQLATLSTTLGGHTAKLNALSSTERRRLGW